LSVVLTTQLDHTARAARVVIVLLVLQFVWSAAPDDLRNLAIGSRRLLKVADAIKRRLEVASQGARNFRARILTQIFMMNPIKGWLH